MLSFDPFSQSQFGLKIPCCTEGERARNQERVWKGKLSGQEARFMKNGGRAEDRVKVCLGDRESESKSKWEIKEVRRILQ